MNSTSLMNYYWDKGRGYLEPAQDNVNWKMVTTTSRARGKYELKGKLNNSVIKEEELTCNVNIDRISPTIVVNSILLNSINLSFSDTGGSGFIGYKYSTTPQTEHNKSQFTNKTNITIDKTPSSSISYYIYAMDGAGNVSEEIVYAAGEKEYPKITATPIDNSFSKFKVTVEDISGSGYDIDDIKVQYDFDKLISEVDSFEKDNEYDVKFKNAYKKHEWNSLSGKSNILNYEDTKVDGECNDTKCSFIIDMESAIEKCMEWVPCKRMIDNDDGINNLSINYYIYAKNNKGNYTDIKFNSKLNVYYNKRTFSNSSEKIDGLHQSVYYSSQIYITTSIGDLIASEIYDGLRTLYYYDTSDGITNRFFSYSPSYDTKRQTNISYTYLDNTKIKFTLCNITRKNDFTSLKTNPATKTLTYYEYNFITKELDKIKTTQTYHDDGRESPPTCSSNSSITFDNYSSIKYSDLENSGFLNRFIGYLNDIEQANVKNYDWYAISTNSATDIVNKKIFYSGENGEWMSVLTTNQSNFVKYPTTNFNKLFFKSEVTLTQKSKLVGKV